MAGHTENSVVIEAPLDLVWDMTNDIESWPALFTEYASVEVLRRIGPTVRFRLTLKPDQNGTAWSWVSDRTSNPATRTVRAHRVETGNFEFMDIFWEYTELSDGVQMRWVQDFHMLDTAPVDDEAMTNRLNTNTVIQMNHIKRAVEKRAAELSEGAFR
ncbi:SRPBCC family protein [Fodinicola feengrottensis]|uniref:SRPBCC family protein n=1 Tax=Fodinicola feengrottensis TaxID=435914 RepID=A0ABP4U859_9ACTN|nr:SRPBCC family protein [Fodinicola feengrottensis]